MNQELPRSRSNERRNAARLLYQALCESGPRPLTAAEIIAAADLVRAQLAQLSDDGERIVIAANKPTYEGTSAPAAR